MRRLVNQQGISVIMVLVVITIAFFILSGAVFISVNETKQAKLTRDTLAARYASEAGAKMVLAHLRSSSPDWSWLQTNNNTLIEQRLISGDPNTTFSVVVKSSNSSDNSGIITNPSNEILATSRTYYIQSTGKSGNITQKYVTSVTIPATSSSLAMRYVVDMVKKAVYQGSPIAGAGNSPSATYEVKSWNGILRLLLQEGTLDINDNFTPTYAGTGWISNWHHGYDTGSVPKRIDEIYGNNGFVNNGNYSGIMNSSKTAYHGLWKGKSSVLSITTLERDSLNLSEYSNYLPAWVLISNQPSYSYSAISGIVDSKTSTANEKLLKLKGILGTIIVYHKDGIDSSVEIFKINVDLTTKVISISDYTTVPIPS